MGSWAVGEAGDVHLEWTHASSDRMWGNSRSFAYGWSSVEEAIESYRRHAREMRRVLGSWVKEGA